MRNCKDCIWYCDCEHKEVCEDYSPSDDKLEVEAYEQDLRMRVSEYEEVKAEYRD